MTLVVQEAQDERQKAASEKGAQAAKADAKPAQAVKSPQQVDDDPGKYPSKESIGPFRKPLAPRSQVTWPTKAQAPPFIWRQAYTLTCMVTLLFRPGSWLALNCCSVRGVQLLLGMPRYIAQLNVAIKPCM